MRDPKETETRPNKTVLMTKVRPKRDRYETQKTTETEMRPKGDFEVIVDMQVAYRKK
jgi:hypothetical protein